MGIHDGIYSKLNTILSIAHGIQMIGVGNNARFEYDDANSSYLLEINSEAKNISIENLNFTKTTSRKLLLENGNTAGYEEIVAIDIWGSCNNVTIKNCRFNQFNGSAISCPIGSVPGLVKVTD